MVSHGSLSRLVVSRSAVLAAVMTAAAGVTPAFAQGGGGLFGRTISNPNARQTFDMTVSSAGSYDLDPVPAPGVDENLLGGQLPPGLSSVLDSAVNYAYRGPRLQIRTAGTSSQRYFRPLDNLMPATFSNVSQSGAVQLSAGTPRTRVFVAQTGVLSSSPLYSLFTAGQSADAAAAGEAALAPAAPAAYALNDMKSSSYGTTVVVGRQIARRTSLSANVDRQHTDMLAAPPERNVLDMYSVGARMQQGLARSTTMTAGYLYRIGSLDQRGPTGAIDTKLSEHAIEFGLDHRRRLSASRTLSLGLGLGGSAMDVPGVVTLNSTQQSYSRVWAQANVAYDFARGWQAHAGYRQGVDYVVALSKPVAAKSVSASVTGQMTRRLDVSTSAGYSSGETAVTALGSAFDTYTGDARFRVAVARSFAVYVEYLYYFYDSRGTLPLVPGLPGQLERNTVRVGFMLRIPTR